MEEKTIATLNAKVWYRLLKVFFIIALPACLILLNINIFGKVWMNGKGLLYFVFGNFLVLCAFELVRKVFYYIYFGSFFPKK
jgi:hypothetical protein